MANNSYDKFLACSKQKLNPEHVTLECSVGLEADENIAKILSMTTTAVIEQVEVLSGEASVNGTVFINVMYITENGAIGSSGYTTNFISKVIEKALTPHASVFVKAVVAESKVLSLNNNNAKVICTVELHATMIKNNEVTYLKDAGENVCLKQEELSSMYLITDVNSTWSENTEIALKEPVRSILATSVELLVKNYETGLNYVLVEGEVVVRLLYLTDAENPEMKTIIHKNDFRQEVEVEQAKKGQHVEIDIDVVQNNVKALLEEKGDTCSVNVEIPVKTNIRVYEMMYVNTVCDLFSTTHTMNVTNTSFENCILQDPEFFEKSIEGSLTLTENVARIDKLLSVSGYKISISNCYVKNEQIFIEGIINTNLVYLNDEEDNIKSVDVEMPFVVSNGTDAKTDSLLDVRVSLFDVDVMVKKGRDIYIDAKLKANINICNHVQGAIISDTTINEMLPIKDSAIEIYFAKAGDTVWDIAKQLKIKQDIILLQNPDVIDPLDKDTNITLYYNKKRD